MNILSLEQAIEQGSTPTDLRVLANSLERIAWQGYYHVGHKDDPELSVTREYLVHEPAYDTHACRENARGLRQLAKALQSEYRKK